MSESATEEPFVFQPDAAVGSGQSSASLIDRARQEIAGILREVSLASHQDWTRSSYVAFLVDRVHRAIAGGGVVLWTHQAAEAKQASVGPDTYVAEHRLGDVTDLDIPDAGAESHQTLLRQIGQERSPVVVPNTSGAILEDVPANPSPVPVALIPIERDPQDDWPHAILEVFLETGGTLASQRGCLRFLSQIATHGAETFRGLQLRSLQQSRCWRDRFQPVRERILESADATRISHDLVDAIADVIDAPRIALCRRLERRGIGSEHAASASEIRYRIEAVSYVSRIDHLSDAAKETTRVASSQLEKISTEHGAYFHQRPQTREDSDAPITPTQVLAIDPSSPWRLVVWSEVAKAKERAAPVPDDALPALTELLSVAASALTNAQRVSAMPFARFWMQPDALMGSRPGGNPKALARRLLPGLVMASVGLMACFFPIPMVLSVKGVIRPAKVDAFHATHTATVARIDVEHGDVVKPGDTLLVLESTDLANQRTDLIGKRRRLMEQRAIRDQELMRLKVATSESKPTIREIDEQIATIERQIKIVESAIDSLTLRARNAGRVEAFALHERYSNRPIPRGEELMRVVPTGTPWVVDAEVPQSSVPELKHAIRDDRVATRVIPIWDRAVPITASQTMWGHVSRDPTTGQATIVLRWKLDLPPGSGPPALSGSPAKVAIDCGNVALGWYLIEEVVGWLQVQRQVYFA
ncbi:MAG: biotin/lipoyl-binding protein [Planctomycetota bacterium]